MTIIRDFFRKRRVARHMKAHGPVFTYHGLTVHVPRDVDVGLANALMKAKYETEEAAFVQAHLPADRPLIELGGSLGVVSALIGSRLAPNVPHLILEANPDLIEICQKNASADGTRTATQVRHSALSYGGAEVSFMMGDNAHVSRLAGGPGGGGTGRQVTVPAVTLAKLHGDLGAPDGYSLVCDIEGAETDIIANDADTLARAGFILLETHPTFYAGGEAEAETLITTIQDLGFRRIEQRGVVIAFGRNG